MGSDLNEFLDMFEVKKKSKPVTWKDYEMHDVGVTGALMLMSMLGRFHSFLYLVKNIAGWETLTFMIIDLSAESLSFWIIFDTVTLTFKLNHVTFDPCDLCILLGSWGAAGSQGVAGLLRPPPTNQHWCIPLPRKGLHECSQHLGCQCRHWVSLGFAVSRPLSSKR